MIQSFDRNTMYCYTLSTSADPKVFLRVCSTLEQNGFTKIDKLLEDVDGSLIQEYFFDNMKIRVECDVEIGAVYVDSQINLMKYLNGILNNGDDIEILR